jgi:hypothetical protein
MAGAVAALLQKPDERERWRRRGLVRASNFSWRTTAEQTLAVYRKVYELVRDQDQIASSSAPVTVRDQDAA